LSVFESNQFAGFFQEKNLIEKIRSNAPGNVRAFRATLRLIVKSFGSGVVDLFYQLGVIGERFQSARSTQTVTVKEASTYFEFRAQPSKYFNFLLYRG
jgi:hypothetical protein